MASSRRHILLVEEHADIRTAFTAFFETLYDYALHLVTETREAIGFTSRRGVDLAVVDLTRNPEAAARLDMIRTWRGHALTFPVIATSAQDFDGLSVDAFEAGADDFLRKPYLFEEMRARIQRHLTRRHSGPVGLKRVDGLQLPEKPFACAGAIVSPDLRITFPNGRVLRLTPKQFGILREISSHAGKLLLKDSLVYAVWGADANVNSASVHQYIHLLRKMFRDAGVDLNGFITPESKAGWRIASHASAAVFTVPSSHDLQTSHRDP